VGRAAGRVHEQEPVRHRQESTGSEHSDHRVKVRRCSREPGVVVDSVDTPVDVPQHLRDLAHDEADTIVEAELRARRSSHLNVPTVGVDPGHRRPGGGFLGEPERGVPNATAQVEDGPTLAARTNMDASCMTAGPTGNRPQP